MEGHAKHPENFEVKVVRSIWSRTWVRLCMVFLAGLISGFVIFSFSSGISKTKNLPAANQQAAPASLRAIDSLQPPEVLHYDTPLTKAVCKVHYSARFVEVRIDLSSLYPLKSLIEFDVNNLSIINIQHISVNDQSTSMAAASFVQINSTGDNKYIVLLANRNSLPHKIEFTISQNESQIYKNAVEINK